ncbi:MAG: response regulator [Bryobacterales bacterium]|nr:response regulator [Bryobacterales bacterium]
MSKGLHILIVEDNEADVFLIREAIAEARIEAEITVVSDGHAATAFFDTADRDDEFACPDLVLLDLNLPKKPGFEVLRHKLASRRCQNARVVIVTSSDSAKDRAEARALGADAYFRKPSDFEAFMKLGDVVAGLASSAV